MNPPLSIGQIANIFWGEKKIITPIIITCTLLMIVATFFIRPMYEAETILKPTPDLNSGGGMGNIASKVGSLAGLIELGGEDGNKINFAQELIKSKSFILQFVSSHSLLPDLFAFKWDEKTKNWEKGKSKPTNEEIVQEFRKRMSFSRNGLTGFVTIKLTWSDPTKATELLTDVISQVNLITKTEKLLYSDESIKYLQEKLVTERNSGVRDYIGQLIQKEYSQSLLANVSDTYVFSYIDPPLKPDSKSYPRKSLFGIFGIFIGFMISVIYIFYKISVVMNRTSKT